MIIYDVSKSKMLSIIVYYDCLCKCYISVSPLLIRESNSLLLMKVKNTKCRGFVMPAKELILRRFPFTNQQPTAPPSAENEELEMAMNASLQSAAHQRPPDTDTCIASIVKLHEL